MIDRVKPLMAAWVLVFASSSFASETAENCHESQL